MKTQAAFYQGGVLPRELLVEGFPWRDEWISLVGPRGIWKPRQFPALPLSITTKPPPGRGQAPRYDDEVTDEGILLYRYQERDPRSWDNSALREAWRRSTPLIWFRGVLSGWYLPVWPVTIIKDDEPQRTFTVDLHGATATVEEELHIGDETADTRRYALGTIRRRLHQHAFHRLVLGAYSGTCAICRLRHNPLVEASHILDDKHPRGEPIVPNGLALCTLHHRAFDAHLLGVTPDYRVAIKQEILDEEDGPMLVHGLQRFQNAPITTPRNSKLKPSRDFLAERYELFRRAG